MILFYFLLICICSHVSAASLSDEATNPITRLSQLQFENDYSYKNYGTNRDSNEFYIKPIIALERTEKIPFEQVIRFKFQVPTIPKTAMTRSSTSLGDTQGFDLFVFEVAGFGRWGIGPMAIFPTATKVQAGQRQWQLGSALAMSILRFPGWQIGFLAQNPISIGGNQPKQNTLYFQPILVYHFEKNSYLVSNAEWTIDWQHHKHQIPINFGIGHTFSKIDTSIQFEWMAYKHNVKSFVSEYTIQFCLNYLFD